MSLREHGINVDREYRKLCRDLSVDPQPYVYRISLEAARVILENKLDQQRLESLINRNDWREFVEATDKNLIALFNSLSSAMTTTAANAGMGLGLGMAVGWVIGAAFAPITGGASFVAMTTLGASGAFYGGIIGFTKAVSNWHNAYSQHFAQRREMLQIVASGLRNSFTAEKILDYILATDLLLSPWDDGTIIAIDVYAGQSSTEFHKKQDNIKRYRLTEVFGENSFGGISFGGTHGTQCQAKLT